MTRQFSRLAKKNWKLHPRLEGLERRDVPSFLGGSLYPTGGDIGIAVADFNGDSRLDVATLDNGSNGDLCIALATSSGTLLPPVRYPINSDPVALDVGDLDADGDMDVVATTDGGDRVIVLLGVGDGTFQTAVNYVVANSPEDVILADFNADGKLDVATAAGSSSSAGWISVLLGNGDGTLAPRIDYDAGLGARKLDVADFNEDGILDLALENNVDGAGIMLGNGDGSFQPRVNLGANGSDLVTTDLNGDGHFDIAVTGAKLEVFYGNGDGTFKPKQEFPLPLGGGYAATGDFDADGDVDIVVTAPDQSGVIVLRNQAGNFRRRSAYAVTPASAIAVADWNGDSKLDVVMVGVGTAGILLGNGDGSFRGASHYAGLSWGAVSSITDIDGDSVAEVALAADNAVNVLLGRSNGTFKPGTSFTVGGSNNWHVSALEAADFDGDAITDLAIAKRNGFLVFLQGLGGGQFSVDSPTFPAEGNNPTVGDFNNDGFVDVALANHGFNYISVLLGNGDGTVQAPTTFAVGPKPSFPSVAGDFNGDGNLDLAVANAILDGTISMLLGNGDGSFEPFLSIPAGVQPQQVVTGDFNVDGNLDFAAPNLFNHTVTILLGNGDGTFRSGPVVPTDEGPKSITAGDVNGDGVLDLVTANGHPNSHTAGVLIGRGDGTFKPAVNYFAGNDPQFVTLADVNGDGRSDIIVQNNNSPDDICVLLNHGDGTFMPKVSYTAPASASVVIWDIDTDGDLDIVGPNGSVPGVTYLRGNGDGTFAAQRHYLIKPGANSLAIADMNEDGLLDLIAASGTGSLNIVAGTGDGLAAAPVYSIPGSTESMVVRDFNGDGSLDIAMAHELTTVGTVMSVVLGGASSDFQPAVIYAGGKNAKALAVADFNNDDILDIAVTNESNTNVGRVSIFLGVGDGSFTTNGNFAANASPKDITVSDFNGDGILDLAVTNELESGTMSVLFGIGGGAFAAPGSYAVGYQPKGIQAGDFNLDGFTDVAVNSTGGLNAIAVFMGNGDGTFQLRVDYAPGNDPDVLRMHDFNGDGYPDLLATEDNGVTVLFNAADWPPLPIGDGPRPVMPLDSDNKHRSPAGSSSEKLNASASDMQPQEAANAATSPRWTYASRTIARIAHTKTNAPEFDTFFTDLA